MGQALVVGVVIAVGAALLPAIVTLVAGSAIGGAVTAGLTTLGLSAGAALTVSGLVVTGATIVATNAAAMGIGAIAQTVFYGGDLGQNLRNNFCGNYSEEFLYPKDYVPSFGECLAYTAGGNAITAVPIFKLLRSAGDSAQAALKNVNLAGKSLDEIVRITKVTQPEAVRISTYVNSGGKFDVQHYNTISNRFNLDANAYLNVKARIDNHIIRGEFDVNGFYKFSGLHDYDNFINVVQTNRVHPAYQWKWKQNNPNGVSVVEYRKIGAAPDWKEKTLAPRGTPAESFMDAGMLLREEYLRGDVLPALDKNKIPIPNQIISKTKIGKYRVHGFTSVGNSIDTSSWWFTD